MMSAKTFARFGLLFALAILLGVALALAEYWVPGHAAYTPTPTKTPRPAKTLSFLNPATDTPTPVSEKPTVAMLAPATRAPAIPSTVAYAATLPPTAKPNLVATATQSAMRPPAATPTASEIPLAQPTSRPDEPVFTVTPLPLPTHAPSPTPGATSRPTSTPAVTETVPPTFTCTPTADDTPTVTPTSTWPPTATATAAFTPSPTATSLLPLPTPTALPDMGGGWRIINPNDYRAGGDVHVLGEVYNQTANTLWIVSVRITFRLGRQLTPFDASPETTLLPAGRKIAFHANAGPITFDSYTLSLQYEAMPPGGPRTDLGIAGGGMALRDGVYHVQGEVDNQGPELSDCAQVIATLFDGSGRVAGVSSVFIEASELRPGQRASFQVPVSKYGPDVTRYEVQVFGF